MPTSLMSFADFFGQYGLIILLVLLLVFMFYSSRRRVQKQKVEQEQKARQTVPGAEVLLQGGLYGTIVEFDPDNLDQPALVEIAPGVDIKVHSQAILRVVNPAEGLVTEDEFIEAEASEAEYIAGVAGGDITSISDDQRIAESRRTTADADARIDPDVPGTKPQA
ncbi:preprotein translocase subunit YajC [Microbacterium lemovicicum]|nr:preprotein translocase subunit YajC [Microbacterium lemovicicum]